MLKYLFHRYGYAGKVITHCGFTSKLCTSLCFKIFNSVLVMQEGLHFITDIKANKHYAKNWVKGSPQEVAKPFM